MNPSFDNYKYGLLIAGMPDVLAEAYCGGPEFRQTITDADEGDVQQTESVTVVEAGGAAALVLKPATMFGERRHVVFGRDVDVKAPASTQIDRVESLTLNQKNSPGAVGSFIWLGDTYGWARYA